MSIVKKTGASIALIAMLACLQACGKPSPLISSGTLIHAEIFEPESPSSTSYGITKFSSGKVEVYPNFIIVTNGQGESFVAEHGSYRNLRYRK